MFSACHRIVLGVLFSWISLKTKYRYVSLLHVQAQNCLYFSNFATKTYMYVVVLIRSASARHFWWVPTTLFLWRNKKIISLIPSLIWNYGMYGVSVLILSIRQYILLNILRENHYENTLIQIHWKFYHQKMTNFQIKYSYIFHISAKNYVLIVGTH